MRFQGKIISWEDIRGFGYVRWNGAQDKLFVHVRAFADHDRRPALGDIISYEVGQDADGRACASKAEFADAARYRRRMARAARGGMVPLWMWPAGIGTVLVLGSLAFWQQQPPSVSSTAFVRATGSAPAPDPVADLPDPAVWPAVRTRLRRVDAPAATSAPAYSCEGKTFCSQMTSCEEATFYLRNCPGTQMDGDGDGVPCESQWCG